MICTIKSVQYSQKLGLHEIVFCGEVEIREREVCRGDGLEGGADIVQKGGEVKFGISLIYRNWLVI